MDHKAINEFVDETQQQIASLLEVIGTQKNVIQDLNLKKTLLQEQILDLKEIIANLRNTAEQQKDIIQVMQGWPHTRKTK